MRYRFEWDAGNAYKSIIKHGINNVEAESVFNDKRKIILKDLHHSSSENRYFCYAKSIENRILTTIFTIRNQKIRVISSRPANKKERNLYENK